MTRVNVGIDVRELPNQLLMTEHREIPRIPNAIHDGRANLEAAIPEFFKLGPGHVVFFYPRMNYLRLRYHTVYCECRKRQLDVQYYGESFERLPAFCYSMKFRERQKHRRRLLKRFKEKGHVLLPAPWHSISG